MGIQKFKHDGTIMNESQDLTTSSDIIKYTKHILVDGQVKQINTLYNPEYGIL